MNVQENLAARHSPRRSDLVHPQDSEDFANLKDLSAVKG